MNIRIYQINHERDEERVKFLGMEELEKLTGSRAVDSNTYDKVFDGEVDCKTLDEIYELFNFEHPDGFKGHSLSVSDVIEVVDAPKLMGVMETSDGTQTFTDLLDYLSRQEMLREDDVDFTAHDYFTQEKFTIEPGFHFVDSIGFQKIDFSPELTQEAKGTIRVVYLEPGKLARITEIGTSLEELQQAVGGGFIEPFYPFEEQVCIVCNDEGKICGMELNRAVRSEDCETEVSYAELRSAFRKAEQDGHHLTGMITFTEDSFDEPYSLEARTYLVSSDNKAFRPNMGGYSIYGASLDGSDPCVRLERYMADEHGGKDGWKVERCVLKEPGREILDIIAGPCFICDCSTDSFGSLSDEQLERYMEKFKYPERFVRINDEIAAIPYNPKNKDYER